MVIISPSTLIVLSLRLTESQLCRIEHKVRLNFSKAERYRPNRIAVVKTRKKTAWERIISSRFLGTYLRGGLLKCLKCESSFLHILFWFYSLR